MKIIFFGSDDFAVAHLEALCASKYDVIACVTQPDKKKGRHLQVGASLVKKFALQEKIPLLQPDDLRDKNFVHQLKNFDSDLFVVVAYGKILPKEIITLPKIFCINIHGSLLPKYRGAAPINWAIMSGEERTGISVIKMNEEMDAGDIISQKEVKIDKNDTAVSLRAKMAEVSAAFLMEVLDAIEAKSYRLTKQDKKAVTYAPKLTKELGLIDWKKPALEIHNLVRGLLPWPCAYTFYCGKQLKVLRTEVVQKDSGKFSPGEVIDIAKDGFIVVAGKDTLKISQVHLESAKPMDAKSFLAGHKLGIGFRFVKK